MPQRTDSFEDSASYLERTGVFKRIQEFYDGLYTPQLLTRPAQQLLRLASASAETEQQPQRAAVTAAAAAAAAAAPGGAARPL